MESVGELLRALRRKRGMTQVNLAHKAHVTARTLQYWEANRQQPREVELESVLTVLVATPWERGQIYALLTDQRSVRLARSAKVMGNAPTTLAGPHPGIGDLIQAMRHRRGWTQEQFAAEMKVNRTSVVRWETTCTLPSEDTLERLCHLLKASQEERDALCAGRLLPNHWSPQLTLEECREQYDLLCQIRDGNNTLMPLTDLYTLALKKQIYYHLPQSSEALRLLAMVEMHHCWWLYVQERTAEACARSSRLLKMTSGILAPDISTVRALNLLSQIALSGPNGDENAVRLLSPWLNILPERFHYWLLCDMALYAGRANQPTTAYHFLKQAQQARTHIIQSDTDADKEWHIEWYYRMTTARVFISTGKADAALEWLPAMERTGDGRLFELLVWGEAYLIAGEKNLASNCLREAQIALVTLPLPKRQAKLDQLAQRL